MSVRSFPSRHAQKIATHAASLLDQVAAEQSALIETKSAIARAQETRVPSDARTAALRELSILQSEVKYLLPSIYRIQNAGKFALQVNSLEAELDGLKERDPVEIAKFDASIETCRVGANRWTDNISAVRSFLVKKKGMSAKEVKDYFIEFELIF